MAIAFSGIMEIPQKIPRPIAKFSPEKWPNSHKPLQTQHPIATNQSPSNKITKANEPRTINPIQPKSPTQKLVNIIQIHQKSNETFQI